MVVHLHHERPARRGYYWHHRLDVYHPEKAPLGERSGNPGHARWRPLSIPQNRICSGDLTFAFDIPMQAAKQKKEKNNKQHNSPLVIKKKNMFFKKKKLFKTQNLFQAQFFFVFGY